MKTEQHLRHKSTCLCMPKHATACEGKSTRTHPDSYREHKINLQKHISFSLKFLFFIFSLQAMGQTTVTEAWTKTYNGAANGPDGGKDIAVDSAGNVYVAGASTGSGSGADFLMAKYETNGDTLWVRRYNGTGNGHDIAVKVILDANGNIFVCGNGLNASYNYDFLTLKYDNNGNLLWTEVYDGTGGGNDEAKGLAIDGGVMFMLEAQAQAAEPGATMPL